MAKILIVEDERKLNDLVRDYLGSLGYQTVQLFDGGAAVAFSVESEADLVVLDLMLPGLDGLEVARQIRSRHDWPILMLTARDTEADKILGLEVGADDYMTKPFSVRELAARIRAILRRSTRQKTETEGGPIRHAGVEMDPVRRTVRRLDREVPLTSAQFDLLKILMSAPGRVFTRGELIETLSGYVYEGYERTIDVQVKNIRKVLEDDPAEPALIQTVRGVGYRFLEHP